MKVVILTKHLDEGTAHARLAGLALQDVIIPGNESILHGLRLTDDDLIVELPSFAGHPREEKIRTSLRVIFDICRCNPPWERIGR